MTQKAETAEVLPNDTVCACLSETGERKVRLYERCERCGSFMEADYLAERLEETRSDTATVWIRGYPARSWEQVAEYLSGDAHDRSKVQVRIGKRWLNLAVRGKSPHESR